MATTYGSSTPARSSARPGPDDPTLGALVASASRDLSALVRDEIELAKTELKDDVKHAGVGAGMFAVAGVVALLASVLLSFCLVYVLVELGLPTWASFLVVGGVYLLVAGAVAFVGLRQVKQVKAPERTLRSSKETVAVLKGAGRGGARR
ncbi:phage holin family protein [Vallicoccus soli]|uniref:Phage holin family protein n=1 Tax=Vallicoccus soli TaxID=2339232 RepID=A0A3A3Z2L0_9ACTN|nr:phage holin family protein [Vallicoccus soli]RJK97674.1 phage holin family protein [Vallicoccus soli]